MLAQNARPLTLKSLTLWLLSLNKSLNIYLFSVIEKLYDNNLNLGLNLANREQAF